MGLPLIAAEPSDPRADALMNAQQRKLRAAIRTPTSAPSPAESTEPFAPAVLEGEGSVLLTWEEDGELLACGALKRLDLHRAEVKRIPGRRRGAVAWGACCCAS